MMVFFRGRSSRVTQDFRLHFLSVSRQVHSCMFVVLFLQKTIFKKYYYLSLLASKKKKVFMNEWDCSWLAVEPRFDVVVEVPSYWGAVSLGLRTNVPRLVQCRNYVSAKSSRMGWRRHRYLLPFACPRTAYWVSRQRKP